MTLTNSARPLVVATASESTSLVAAVGDVSTIYTNSEPYLCADYEYEFVDLDGNAVADDLSSRLSVAADKIYFDQNGYDNTVYHL